MSKRKLTQKMISLNQQWWKKRDDPVVLKNFMDCCWEIGKHSVEVSESGLLMLRDWIYSFGGSYTRVHRYHVRIKIGVDVIDLKLNYLDFEYFALVNDKLEKMFTNIQDVKPWLSTRFIPISCLTNGEF
ncbi:hypothetical protein HGO21_03585 [Acinetobacter sp. CUI P1]|nr:hypothetical protein [Acinetobacter sp. CUI P1]